MCTSDEISILHLSDIHFGRPSYSWKYAKKENVLNSLIEKISNLGDSWMPNIVVVSGDVGWSGSREDYELAEEWFQRLMSEINISGNNLIFCPGNHDINRSYAKFYTVPNDIYSADELLGDVKNLIRNYTLPFQEFISFQDNLEIPKLKIDDIENYLVGYRDILDLRFIILNSSWCSRSDRDRSNLWIGAPHIELLESNGIIPGSANYDTSPLTIAILHHGSEWFHQREYSNIAYRKAPYNKLKKMSHLILVGHEHPDEDQGDERFHGLSRLFRGGATYGDSLKKEFNRYWCSLLKINRNQRVMHRKVLYKEYDWIEHQIEEYWLHADQPKIILSVKEGGIPSLNSMKT